MTIADQQCLLLRDSLPGPAREQLESLLNGQTTKGGVAAFGFLLKSNKLIWPTLLCLHRWGASPELLQECIRLFWKEEKYNRAIFNSTQFTLESAREMFRLARFPPPSGLPSPIQVWRGTAGKTKAEACKGLCWTLDRDAACWFATQRGENARTPLVVTAHVRPDQILFCDNECDGLYEQEAVLDAVESAEIDGVESEWRERGKYFAKKRDAFQRSEYTGSNPKPTT